MVEVNYFPINAKSLINKAYHYDWDMKPPASRKFTSQAVEVFMNKHFRNVKNFAYAFDSKKNIYTNCDLKVEPMEPMEDKVDINVDQYTIKTYEVKFAYAATVDLSILKK